MASCRLTSYLLNPSEDPSIYPVTAKFTLESLWLTWLKVLQVQEHKIYQLIFLTLKEQQKASNTRHHFTEVINTLPQYGSLLQNYSMLNHFMFNNGYHQFTEDIDQLTFTFLSATYIHLLKNQNSICYIPVFQAGLGKARIMNLPHFQRSFAIPEKLILFT